MMIIMVKKEDVFIGDIAEQYLRKFTTMSGADTTFELQDKDGNCFILETRKQK